MKKKILNISKETLKTLSSKQLADVVGGVLLNDTYNAAHTVDVCNML